MEQENSEEKKNKRPWVMWLLFIGASVGIFAALYLMFAEQRKRYHRPGMTLQDAQSQRLSEISGDTLVADTSWISEITNPGTLEKISTVHRSCDAVLDSISNLEMALKALPDQSLASVRPFWMGEGPGEDGRGDGQARELANLLERFENELNAELPEAPGQKKLAIGDLYNPAALSGNSSWEYTTLGSKDGGESLTFLKQLQARIRSLRLEALERIRPKSA